MCLLELVTYFYNWWNLKWWNLHVKTFFVHCTWIEAGESPSTVNLVRINNFSAYKNYLGKYWLRPQHIHSVNIVHILYPQFQQSAVIWIYRLVIVQLYKLLVTANECQFSLFMLVMGRQWIRRSTLFSLPQSSLMEQVYLSFLWFLLSETIWKKVSNADWPRSSLFTMLFCLLLLFTYSDIVMRLTSPALRSLNVITRVSRISCRPEYSVVGWQDTQCFGMIIDNLF